MNKKLFTNQITVNSKQSTVHEILANPQNLLQWVPEVTNVNSSHNVFNITRTETAFNQQEQVVITQGNNIVNYQSTNGNIEYNITFSLSSDNTKTTIEETVFMTKLRAPIPINLFTPIAKHAFKINLRHLKSFIELV